MRWLGPAAIAVWLLLAAQAQAQQTLSKFVAEGPFRGNFKLECFQAGQKVISESNLRIPANGLLVTQDGRRINVAVSADLACIITQTSK